MNLQIKNDFLTATFNAIGAELISLKSDEKEYIWEGNPEFWGKHSPILFPIVGALKEDIYFFEGKEYQLPRHGFAREKAFEVVEKVDDRIVFSLKNDTETLKVYPFYFELKIEYKLVESKLNVQYSIKNNSGDKMYFSIGGHPAFKLPNHFESYSLIFESQEELRFSLLENNLLAEETSVLKTRDNQLPLKYQLFEKDALVFKNQNIKSVTIRENQTDFLKVHVNQFPDLGIWTKDNAPFICIEPWFGHADFVQTNQKLIDKSGIQKIEKEGNFQSAYTIEVF
jgi:galactose mutarotase-like enzyme